MIIDVRLTQSPRNDKSSSKSAAIITNGQRIRFRERRQNETPPESLNQFRRRIISEAQSIASSQVILGGSPTSKPEI